MKVIISNYPSRMSCKLHSDYMNKKYGYIDWPVQYTWFEKFLEKVEDCVNWVYNHTVNMLFDRREQRILVRIDRWDTWAMDYTLAKIILPMLKQLKATKHGAPLVEMQDRPKHLTGGAIDEYGLDEHHFEAWDWALDEMIYAFDCKANKDETYFRLVDPDEVKAENARIHNGFVLFGKYYEGLWD